MNNKIIDIALRLFKDKKIISESYVDLDDKYLLSGSSSEYGKINVLYDKQEELFTILLTSDMPNYVDQNTKFYKIKYV